MRVDVLAPPESSPTVRLCRNWDNGRFEAERLLGLLTFRTRVVIEFCRQWDELGPRRIPEISFRFDLQWCRFDRMLYRTSHATRLAQEHYLYHGH